MKVIIFEDLGEMEEYLKKKTSNDIFCITESTYHWSVFIK